MRVTVSKEIKKHLTVSEMPAVNEIIKLMKDDKSTVEDYARMAMASLGYIVQEFEIYRASATIAKNQRANDAIFEGSNDLDVWIEYLAFDSYYGAYDCGVYLSDLWGLTEENEGELCDKMYLNAFTKGGKR